MLLNTVSEFLAKCELVFPGKTLTVDQSSIYRQKLSHFSPDQLGHIYEEIIETQKYFPKIADVFDAARTLGYMHPPERPVHTWDKTSCALCHGEGRIAVIWDVQPVGERIIETLHKIWPYSESGSADIPTHGFRTLSRCKCLAGGAPTIPKSWQKWTGDAAYSPLRHLGKVAPSEGNLDDMRAEFHTMLDVANLQHAFPASDPDVITPQRKDFLKRKTSEMLKAIRGQEALDVRDTYEF